jgi:hypothetical protein
MSGFQANSYNHHRNQFQQLAPFSVFEVKGIEDRKEKENKGSLAIFNCVTHGFGSVPQFLAKLVGMLASVRKG